MTKKKKKEKIRTLTTMGAHLSTSLALLVEVLNASKASLQISAFGLSLEVEEDKEFHQLCSAILARHRLFFCVKIAGAL